MSTLHPAKPLGYARLIDKNRLATCFNYKRAARARRARMGRYNWHVDFYRVCNGTALFER